MSFLIVTCEHGGNRIPAAFRQYFADAGELLDSHRGFDAGALAVYRLLLPLAGYHQHNLLSRLLVDFNRSAAHPHCFSAITRPLSAETRRQILLQYYLPYRQTLARVIEGALKKQPLIHIAVHSFTPRLGSQIRSNSVGLLYDPSRLAEKEFCRTWRRLLREAVPGLEVRFNYPYRGSADGLTTTLRRQWGERYLGLELELNQARLERPAQLGAVVRDTLRRLLSGALRENFGIPFSPL